MSYGLDDRYSILDRERDSFFFILASRTVLGPTQPQIQWVQGLLKQQGHEADHSPSSSAEMKNRWSYISTPQYVFMAWNLVNRRTTLPLTYHENVVCPEDEPGILLHNLNTCQ
jgi:hypothetical protein